MPTALLSGGKNICTRRRGGAEETCQAARSLVVIPTLWTLLCLVVALQVVVSAAVADPGYKPSRVYVPDERTAIAIAEAVLVPISGAGQVAQERPFHAVLRGKVWEVAGSLPPGWDGGVAVVQINKDDGHILRVTHGK